MAISVADPFQLWIVLAPLTGSSVDQAHAVEMYQVGLGLFDGQAATLAFFKSQASAFAQAHTALDIWTVWEYCRFALTGQQANVFGRLNHLQSLLQQKDISVLDLHPCVRIPGQLFDGGFPQLDEFQQLPFGHLAADIFWQSAPGTSFIG